jgi:hypothetical protein
MADDDAPVDCRPEDVAGIERGVVFDVRPPDLPPGSIAIFDEETDAVIGYQRTAGGWITIHDLDGQEVERREQGLQRPLLDPIDAVFIVGSLAQLIGRGAIRVGARIITGKSAAFLASRVLTSTAAAALRVAFRRIYLGELRFTATTLAHMGTRGRHVPLHILRLAIRHGQRAPDPQGAANAIRYTIEMFRNGQRYTLEVVVRHTDNTILHFLYR